jgi:hypothetical protein
MRKLAIIFAAPLLALAGPVANATLIDIGTRTLDDNTGLEWLDLTETRSLSYNFVSGQLGSGGAYEGWRYANLAETQNLFWQAGFTLDSRTGDIGSAPAGFEPALSYLVSLLGDTLNPFDARYTGILGIIDLSTSLNFHQRLGAYTYRDGASYKIRTDSTCCSVFDDDSYSYNGHFLVRSVSVPEPGTLMLFVTALLLIFRRRGSSL